MRTTRNFLAALWLALIATPVLAHHPGADLDEVMGSKERYFQSIDKPAPSLALQDPDGKAVTLGEFSDKVVVLHFIYAGCPDVCPLHGDKLADVQRMINQSPMKDMVQFISVTTDPVNDTPDVLKTYGAAHGLDPVNWIFATARPDQDESATRMLAEAFGHSFIKTGDGYQTHGVVTHAIARNGRWAANFHGLRFESLNLVLYINGLINNAPAKAPEPGWWDRLKELF